MDVPLTLRAACFEDAELLLRWRNEPSTRSQFFDSSEVQPETHRQWLTNELAGNGSRIYVAELDGLPVGQARIDRRERDRGEISVSVDADARGLGLGRHLIRRATLRAAQELRLLSVEAVVKEANQASLRAFRSAGYGQERRGKRGDEPVLVLTWHR
jgi:RimJ/RimL family protein N-acetyltransferase